MNNPSEQKPNPAPESTAAPALKPGANNNEPPFTIPGPMPEVKPQQEVLHLATQLAQPGAPDAVADAVVAEPHAAKGNGAASQPPKQL